MNLGPLQGQCVCVCVSSRVSVSFPLAFLLQDVLAGTRMYCSKDYIDESINLKGNRFQVHHSSVAETACVRVCVCVLLCSAGLSLSLTLVPVVTVVRIRPQNLLVLQGPQGIPDHTGVWESLLLKNWAVPIPHILCHQY